MAQSVVKWRYLRNKATGRVIELSTNKAKSLMKTGNFVEVPPPDGTPALPPINAQLPPASMTPSNGVLLFIAVGTLGFASLAILVMVARARGLI